MQKRCYAVLFVLLISAPCWSAFAASEVDDTEFLARVGGLSTLYANNDEFRIEYEFESLNRIQGIDRDSVSVGMSAVIVDGDRHSIVEEYVTGDSLEEAREKYADGNATRIRHKKVITPSMVYLQAISHYGLAVGGVRTLPRGGEGGNTYQWSPYRPLAYLERLSEMIDLARVNGSMEETEDGVVCTFVGVIDPAQNGGVGSTFYTLLKFDSIDARFPKYMETGQGTVDLERKIPTETIDIVVSDDSPFWYSEFVYKRFAPNIPSNESIWRNTLRRFLYSWLPLSRNDFMVERNHEKIRITSWEEATPLPEDFRFLVREGAQAPGLEVQETIIEAQ